MFAVIGHAAAFETARPYAGPIAVTQARAIEAWRDNHIMNGEAPSEVNRAAVDMLIAGIDARVTLYGGDEVVAVREVRFASAENAEGGDDPNCS